MKHWFEVIGTMGFVLTMGLTPFAALLWALKPESTPAVPTPPTPVGFIAESGVLVIPGVAGHDKPRLAEASLSSVGSR